MTDDATTGRADAAIRYFASRRSSIAAAIEALAERRGRSLSASPGEGREGMARIAEFCLRGKMIRGCLVFLGAQAGFDAAPAAEGGREDGLASIAAAMELFQAGLLAHDDIMDRDETRRGEPTLHAQYAAEASARYRAEALARVAGVATDNNAGDHLHLGESLGICLGDLCYFEAFAELARILGPSLPGAPENRRAESPKAWRILGLCAQSLSEVAVAQMADVRWGSTDLEPSEEEILAMYRCKTARYSFSLPLSVGALCAGSESLVGPLSELGERLGILFQIRDDELGLFGDSSSTGKGVGSDLREGKKTLFRARLLAAAPAAELPRLSRLLGGGVLAGPQDIAYLRELSEALGVAASIRGLSEESEREARALVDSISGLGHRTRAVLEGLVDYVTRRDR